MVSRMANRMGNRVVGSAVSAAYTSHGERRTFTRDAASPVLPADCHEATGGSAS